MASYLYGLVLARNATRIPGDVRGLDAAPVRAVACDGLAVLVSETVERPRATLEAVRCHDTVLQAVIDAGITVAAARFGQTFATDAGACRYAGDQGGEGSPRIARVLQEFDGCVEMRVLVPDSLTLARVAAATAQPLPPGQDSDAATGPGAAYLERLRERQREGTLPAARVGSIAGAIGPVVRAERVSPLHQGSGAVFAHLVERGAVGEYRAAVNALPALRGRDGRRGVIVVGPLALYSFAEPIP